MSDVSPLKKTEYKNFEIFQLQNGFETCIPEQNIEVLGPFLDSKKVVLINLIGIKSLPTVWTNWLRFLSGQRKSGKTGIVLVEEEVKKAWEDTKTTPNLPIFTDAVSCMQKLRSGVQGSERMFFIKTFVNSAKKVFFVQVQSMCEQKVIAVKSKEKELLIGDVSGIIEVMNNNLTYAVVITFPKQTFVNIANKVLSENYTDVTDENIDLASELINIIYGQAKIVFPPQKGNFKLPLPYVNKGRAFEGFKFEKETKSKLEEGKVITVSFGSAVGEFFIEVWFPEGTNVSEL